MDLMIGFGIFICGMIAALAAGITMIAPLLLAIAVFFMIALKRGFGAGSVAKMVLDGMKRSLVVVVIMILIGALTALWRQCGTIACFTYHGIRVIPAKIFVLSSFLLSGAMSFALGTSFGTCSAVGIILMTIARANGVSPVLTGGAIISGIYIGDRGSPAASSASLVANETGTEVIANVRTMLRISIVPMIACAVIYAALSLITPAAGADSELLNRFPEEFDLSLWCLTPTIVLLALAFCGMKIRTAMLIDIVYSFILCMVLQGRSAAEVAICAFRGFTPDHAELSSVLAGGGIFSMLQISSILLISNGCAGIFGGTGMLSSVEDIFANLSRQAGRFPAMLIASIVSLVVFCNQTIGVIMSRQLMRRAYGDTPEERAAMMIDLEDSVILIAGLVPWCIACSVPAGMLGCGFAAIPFAFYLYLLPIWHLVLSKFGRKMKG